MDNAGAFGSSGATGEFQFITYIKKPQVILRFLGWVGVTCSHMIVTRIIRKTWQLNPTGITVAQHSVTGPYYLNIFLQVTPRYG